MESVLLLGDPRLRTVSQKIEDFNRNELHRSISRLQNTLEEFRRIHGFGRGIAAPQLGIDLRMIAINLGLGSQMIINPVITRKAETMFRLWDDCMSFPNLLVKVQRCTSISLRYQDESGQVQYWNELNRAESELMQHEIDHLDGILAVDRAIDRQSLVCRSEYERNRDYFIRQVDHQMEPELNRA
ncbi:MAG: peptide deformylase [Candidatus Delongbacteria bacterium]|nr:peptide deformylase [Candidatus Delongbacteria bacterium]